MGDEEEEEEEEEEASLVNLFIQGSGVWWVLLCVVYIWSSHCRNVHMHAALEQWEQAKRAVNRAASHEIQAEQEVLASAARAKYEELESRMLHAQGTPLPVTRDFLNVLIAAHRRAANVKAKLLEAEEDERKARRWYAEERAKLNTLMRQADARASPWP